MAFKFIKIEEDDFPEEVHTYNVSHAHACIDLEIAHQLSELVEQNKRIADALEAQSSYESQTEKRMAELARFVQEMQADVVKAIDKGATP